MQNLISIIVPMYNEEKNILNCLEVLKKQTVQNFTVIFVDDGSIDNTVAVLKNELAKNNIFFQSRIIQQPNKGAAAARKAGIDACTSLYVTIFDCDDGLSSNVIEESILSITNTNIDISLCNLQIQDQSGAYKNFVFFDETRNTYSGIECLENSLGGWKVHGLMCCKKEIFQKSYTQYENYNAIENNYINNDEVITRLNFFNASTVIRNNGIYFYKNNLNSTTKSINQNRYLICNNANILYRIFGINMRKTSQNTQKELISTLWGTTLFLIKYYKKIHNKNEWKEKLSETLTFILSEKHNLRLPKKSKIQLFLSQIIIYFI